MACCEIEIYLHTVVKKSNFVDPQYEYVSNVQFIKFDEQFYRSKKSNSAALILKMLNCVEALSLLHNCIRIQIPIGLM